MKNSSNKIFSIKRNENHKIITFLGIKLKFKIKNDGRYSGNHYQILDYLSKYLYATDTELNIKTSNSYNNPIWSLWLQGEDNLPELCKICTESVKKNNPHRPYILITKDTINNYVQMPDYIMQKYEQGIISNTHFSDILRLYLLCQYGGTWIDSSVYMTDKIPDVIENSPFFVFKTINGLLVEETTTTDDYKLLSGWIEQAEHLSSSWFIHSTKVSNILKNTLKLLLEYWKNESELKDYFLLHYLFCLAVLNDEECKNEFLNMPNFSNINPHLLQFKMYENYGEKLLENIKKLSPIHKLSWKYSKQKQEQNYNSLLNYILNKKSTNSNI